MTYRSFSGLFGAMLFVFGGAAQAGEPRAPRDIVTLLPKDAIPAILEPGPLLVAGREAQQMANDTRVLGVALGGEAHAYPIPFLSWHEIVNDVVGGRPIAATW